MTASRTATGGEPAVPGLFNFRPAAGAVPGTLYRSDSPDGLDATGVAALRRHRISLSIDMRSVHETAERPYAIAGIARAAHPVALLEPGAVRIEEINLPALYARLVDAHGPTLSAAVGSLARHEGPVLVHCTAGKDRTGVVVALALTAVGVDQDVVVEDYALSHANLAGAWTDAYLARSPGLDPTSPHVREALNGSPTEVLDGTLDRIAQRYGSAADYLRSHGLSTDEIDRLGRLAP